VKIETAWLAGFFDGEGCVSLHKDKRHKRFSYVPAVALANKNFQVLREIQSAWGGYLRTVKRSQTPPHQWTWTLHLPISCLRRFLLEILPFLKIKSEEARVLVDFLETREAYRARKSGRKFDKSWYAFAEECYWQLRRLKGKYTSPDGVFDRSPVAMDYAKAIGAVMSELEEEVYDGQLL